MTLSSNILQTIKQQHLKQNLRRSYLTKPSSVRKVGILFPGQGAQHVGMGADIYKEFQVARQVIDECEETLGARLRHLMFEGPQNILTLTANAQPAILCHSIALLRVLESEYGFKVKNCTYAMGHSLGEYSALVATDAISLSDAIRLVRLRGEAMQESISNKQTAMSALMISGDNLAEIEEMMPRLARSLGNGEVVEIANINSKSQVLIVNEIVLSGTQNGVKYACSVFQSKGLAGRSLPLPVSAPFHCSLMSNAAEIMGPALEKIQFKMPSIDVISNVTARPFENTKEIPVLLQRQIVETVQWVRCMQYAKNDFVFDWVVVGPSKVLSNIVRKEYPHDTIRSISDLKDIRLFQ